MDLGLRFWAQLCAVLQVGMLKVRKLWSLLCETDVLNVVNIVGNIGRGGRGAVGVQNLCLDPPGSL